MKNTIYHLAWVWDRQFEADVKAGRLDKVGKEVDERFKAGLARPL